MQIKRLQSQSLLLIVLLTHKIHAIGRNVGLLKVELEMMTASFFLSREISFRTGSGFLGRHTAQFLAEILHAKAPSLVLHDFISWVAKSSILMR